MPCFDMLQGDMKPPMLLQATPQQYSPYFLQLLQQPTKLGKVQPLTGVPSRDGKWLRMERISTRTLNSVL